ncbi:ligase-associated DNA damage response DEXH box helicase [Pseudobacteriovorax antillogorgiicola]|uniref:ATP-dependent helicase Lhr and Lhr-like helicase n=1 Tax=Pseudobacteriovorax antillogorgiicola TaxID=1513793 RepID=A0A1Y6C9A6_9BACT|nr:ligase-associated DNA damage response DEXH box helicase [Pseudobacteriovorax antillogorgiicola]TCS49804.1 ATP-dependent Lhr-like helicase [Pseudobacteriovorax antillogorgiicola]SMF43070.1 ATP-dependent helicase Lhr and Lhr-like helicase [Pseudobacteriovorax antillogorgiicola]
MLNPQDPVEFGNAFLETLGWQAKPYQIEAWEAYRDGRSGLLSLPTGSGKTYAAAVGPIWRAVQTSRKKGLQVLYITPLKALARDIEKALAPIVGFSGKTISLDVRTGDTSSYRRSKQRERLADVLITTPESLAILISYRNSDQLLQSCHSVIVDEWHEFFGTKRGAFLELCLSRLRGLNPNLQTWGMSATFGNLGLSCQTLLGTDSQVLIVSSSEKRRIEITTLVPERQADLPLAGHSGMGMMKVFAKDFDWRKPSLVFTNTRSFAERWYQGLIEQFPDKKDAIGLHHGSLDQVNRTQIEDGLKSGELKLVVCTASLDLGLDFSPIERVYQIGSPKSIARLLQRAGRSAHQPGRDSVIRFIPTHGFELFEVQGLQQGVARGDVESPPPCEGYLDVLIQHIVTVGIGPGFEPNQLFNEVRTAWGLRNLSREDYEWCLIFASRGGDSLKAYERYHKITEVDGRYREAELRISRIHRMNIGTITADATVQVKFQGGKRLGHVEERYLSRLKKGDTFTFAGRRLAFNKLYNGVCYVSLAKKVHSQTPRWYGGQLALSAPLAWNLRNVIENFRDMIWASPVEPLVENIIETQERLSALPQVGEVLVELCRTRDGYHCFIFPFEGIHLNQAIGLLLALRLSHGDDTSFQVSVNEYGVELLSRQPFDFSKALKASLFSCDNVLNDLTKSVNLSELSQQQFRTIARIAGLVLQNYPGQRKSGRQVQVSSNLIYQVFERFERGNRLLKLAKDEVIHQQFEIHRLEKALQRLEKSRLLIKTVERLTPFSMPVWASRAATKFDSESLREKIEILESTW